VPTPPVLQPKSESERRRLAELVPATDEAPTVISAKGPAGMNPVARPDDDLRGRRLAHFEIVEPIGAGGMAAVLKATDTVLGRTVALKILPPETAADPAQLTRFQSEARAAAKLDHENVARVYYCGADQGLHFIAFEFVEGENLRSLIEGRGRLSVAESVQIVLQVASGLAHAAARGVVHRDVKPSNIIVTPAGRAKIVDMGLARHRDANADGLTQSGVTLGTFDYISPEQALEPRTADVRSDIYSLGCTFYHALTGKAPVPEGTAAKKLHAHQHLPPADPRAFNRDIPDTVVAVLGRMMAKDPRDRYQRPEELVHDLVGLARHVLPAPGDGGQVRSADGGEGLWVDAPMPAPTAGRTATWAAAAGLAVAAIVAVIEATRPGPPPAGDAIARLLGPGDDSGSVPLASRERERPEVNSEPKTPGTGASAEGGSPPGSPKTSRAVPVQRAADADELRELLKQDTRDVHVVLVGTEPFILNDPEGDGETTGLTFAGKRLVIESPDPANPAVIRFKAAPAADGKPAAALIVGPAESGPAATGVSLTLRGVRFECEGGPEAPVSAIVVTDLEKLETDRCAFVLPDQPAGARPAGAIVIRGKEGNDRPTATLKDCLFVRGAQAVQVLGRAAVFAQHCCFGPHSGGLVHLRDTGGPDDAGGGTLVRMEHCSALLDGGAVVWAEDGAGGTIQVGNCLFTRPASAPEEAADAVLIRQTGAAAGPVVYHALLGAEGQPQRNVYYNLAAVWSDETLPTAPRRAATLEDARGLSFALRDGDRRRAPAFRDDEGVEISQSPWAEAKPLAKLAEAPKEAFAVNLRLARLRAAGPPSMAGSKTVLGALHNVWGPSYPAADTPTDEPLMVRTRIVNPAAPRADSERGIYPSLAHAVLDAKPGDTILIQKNGPLEVEPLRLEKTDMRLTIRAFPRYRPVLTLAPGTETDAAIFRLLDGDLRLEGLEFALRPGRSEYRSQSVVAVGGGGTCTFHECVVTLEEIEGVTLACVSIPDSLASPSMTGAKATPRIRFEACFVRGRGDLIASRSGRRLELEIDGTLAALDGSLFVGNGSPRESGGPSQLRLRRSTAVLTEYVLDLRPAREEDARHAAGPPSVAVSCEETLLAAANGRPLVRVDGADSEEQVKQLLAWTARQTIYGNTGPALVDVVPPAPDRMPPLMPFDAEKWLAFTRAADATSFARVKFVNTPGADRPWTKSRPADFRSKPGDMGRPPETFADVGAPIEALPSPSGE
jgi:hypothetical protein